MINPQKGINLFNNNSIISRIYFVVTILQQPLSRVNYEHFIDKLGMMKNVHPRQEGGVMFLLQWALPLAKGFPEQLYEVTKGVKCIVVQVFPTPC
jgi:hypothetical protein